MENKNQNKHSESEFDIEDLKYFSSLPLKKKLKFLEQMNQFVNRMTPQENKEKWQKLKEMGFMGMMVDPKYGGSGMDMLSYVLVLEQLSAACASTGVTMSVTNSLFCGPLSRLGTEEQKQEFLVPAAKGDALGVLIVYQSLARVPMRLINKQRLYCKVMNTY